MGLSPKITLRLSLRIISERIREKHLKVLRRSTLQSHCNWPIVVHSPGKHRVPCRSPHTSGDRNGCVCSRPAPSTGFWPSSSAPSCWPFLLLHVRTYPIPRRSRGGLYGIELDKLAIFCSVQFVLRFLISSWLKLVNNDFFSLRNRHKLQQVDIKECTDDGIDHIRTAAVMDVAVIQRVGQIPVQPAYQSFALDIALIGDFQILSEIRVQ